MLMVLVFLLLAAASCSFLLLFLVEHALRVGAFVDRLSLSGLPLDAATDKSDAELAKLTAETLLTGAEARRCRCAAICVARLDGVREVGEQSNTVR